MGRRGWGGVCLHACGVKAPRDAKESQLRERGARGVRVLAIDGRLNGESGHCGRSGGAGCGHLVREISGAQPGAVGGRLDGAGATFAVGIIAKIVFGGDRERERFEKPGGGFGLLASRAVPEGGADDLESARSGSSEGSFSVREGFSGVRGTVEG